MKCESRRELRASGALNLFENSLPLCVEVCSTRKMSTEAESTKAANRSATIFRIILRREGG